MALTQVPIELSSTPGIVDNSNATAITIDSSENVGIGSSPIALDGNATPGLTVSSNGPFILLQDANNADKVRYMSNNTGELQFGIVGDNGTTGKTEHMRITSAGNLLVGKTATAVSSDGVEVRNNGLLVATRDNNKAAILNRRSSDGDILEFNKDSGAVGSIGVTGGDILYLACESHGIKINSDAARIDPSDGSGNSSDGQLDLGDSGSRFKDLYLSGGAYLGGTGSANYLEDYEEGTWTMGITRSSPATVSISNTTGSYVKIGSLVTVSIYTASMNVSSAGGGTTDITGLPFTVAAGSKSYAAATFAHTTLFSTTYEAYAAINTTFARVTQVGSISDAGLSAGSPKYMMFSLTYHTNQ